MPCVGIEASLISLVACTDDWTPHFGGSRFVSPARDAVAAGAKATSCPQSGLPCTRCSARWVTTGQTLEGQLGGALEVSTLEWVAHAQQHPDVWQEVAGEVMGGALGLWGCSICKPLLLPWVFFLPPEDTPGSVLSVSLSA